VKFELQKYLKYIFIKILMYLVCKMFSGHILKLVMTGQVWLVTKKYVSPLNGKIKKSFKSKNCTQMLKFSMSPSSDISSPNFLTNS